MPDLQIHLVLAPPYGGGVFILAIFVSILSHSISKIYKRKFSLSLGHEPKSFISLFFLSLGVNYVYC